MSIQKKEQYSKLGSEFSRGDKNPTERIRTLILCILLFVFIALSSFALGKLSAKKGGEKSFVIETIAPEIVPSSQSSTAEKVESLSEKPDATTKEGSENVLVVGSKNSNKYHFPWCSGAKRINPENIVSFPSFEAARAAGYTPAGNCEGLE